jgi:hypothetical protein
MREENGNPWGDVMESAMPSKVYGNWPVLAALLVSALMAACGGTSSDSSSVVATPATGQVALLFTDMPTEDFDHILISYDEVTLLGDDGPQQIYPQSPEDGVQVFDLLSLQQVSDLAFIRDVPAGIYSKLRLHLTGIQLVKGDVVNQVDLVANGKLDLNPQGDFEVRADQILFIELDIDANRSFLAHESGNGRWHFRPVVFMNIFGVYDTRRLMRVFGEVAAVDSAAGTFDLCPTGMISHQETAADGTSTGAEHSLCITSYVNDSGVFSELDGKDLGSQALEVTDPPQQLTMIGFFRSTLDPDGMSEFDARVIELGALDAFARLGGLAVNAPVDYVTEPGTQVFDWAVGAGQSVTEGTVVQTQLQEKTRTFDSEGNEFVDGTPVKQGVTGVVDGIDDNGLFRSSLVVLDALNAGDEQVVGTVATDFDAISGTFAMTTDTTVDVCVSADTKVVKLELLGGVTTLSVATPAEIIVPIAVEATGAMGDTCFEARIVVLDLT